MLRRRRVERGPVASGQVKVRRGVGRELRARPVDPTAVEPDDNPVRSADRHDHPAVKHLVALRVQNAERLELSDNFAGLGQRRFQRPVA
ncbi:MAG: hypothetical protein ACREFX_01000, partial [Opitutaceae bacterium]